MAPELRNFVFHLTTATAWDAAVDAGSYVAPSLETQGFIHASNEDQVARTASRLYADVPDLVVLTIDVSMLGDSTPLVDEPGDPGSDERFPHLYGPLPVEAVTDVRPYLMP